MSASSIRRLDLHVRQVARDDEELRRLQARGDGLADVDAALDDDAVHRRADLGVLEVDLGLRQRRLTLLDDACALVTCARATSSWACTTFKVSASVPARLRELSKSACEMNCRASRSCLRSRSRCALSASSLAFETAASAALTLACALITVEARGFEVGAGLAHLPLRSPRGRCARSTGRASPRC